MRQELAIVSSCSLVLGDIKTNALHLWLVGDRERGGDIFREWNCFHQKPNSLAQNAARIVQRPDSAQTHRGSTPPYTLAGLRGPTSNFASGYAAECTVMNPCVWVWLVFLSDFTGRSSQNSQIDIVSLLGRNRNSALVSARIRPFSLIRLKSGSITVELCRRLFVIRHCLLHSFVRG